MKKYENVGEIKNIKRKAIAYKVKKEYVNFLLNEIKKNKTITMTDLMIKLKEKHNIELSRYHVNKIINDNNITLKLTKNKTCSRKKIWQRYRYKTKFEKFYDEIKKYDTKNIICVDETSIGGLQKKTLL